MQFPIKRSALGMFLHSPWCPNRLQTLTRFPPPEKTKDTYGFNHMNIVLR